MYEALLKSTAEYQKIAESLHTPGPAALFGLPPAGRALLYAALQKDLDRVLCIVTPGEAEATHFADDLKALGLTAAVFPPRDFMLRPVEGAGREYEYRRLSVLGALAGGRLNAVCVPAEALLQYTVPRDEFLRNTLTLKPGMVYNREALVARLFAAGYVRRSQVDGPGQFSVRGDIVDIYAPDMHQPARVEYWDDEIDSLASFDLLTQRRDGSLEKIYLSPAREVLFGNTAETAEALRGAIKKARGKKRTAMEKATEADLAQLDSGLMPEAMDKYYGIRYPQPATLLDHLDSPIFVLDEVGGIRDAQKATEYRRGEELTGLLEEGVLCPGLDVLYQTMDDLAIAAQKQSTLLCENFLRGMNEFRLKDLINVEAFAAPNWGGDLASLREDLDPLVEQGYAIALFAGTPKGAAALTRDLADKGYAVSMSRDVRPAKGLVQDDMKRGALEYHLKTRYDQIKNSFNFIPDEVVSCWRFANIDKTPIMDEKYQAFVNFLRGKKAEKSVSLREYSFRKENKLDEKTPIDESSFKNWCRIQDSRLLDNSFKGDAVRLKELMDADEVIVSSSTKFCSPACEMNGTPIGGKAPELVKLIQEKYVEKFENETAN